VPEGDGTEGLQPLGVAGGTTRLTLARVGGDASASTQAPSGRSCGSFLRCF